MMRRSGFGSQLRPTANVRSMVVYVSHRAEKKLGGPWVIQYHCFSTGCTVTQRLTVLSSLFITPVCVLTVEVTCIDG